MLENDGTITIPLSPGSHTVKISLHFRKNIFNVNLSGDVYYSMKFDRITGKILVMQTMPPMYGM